MGMYPGDLNSEHRMYVFRIYMSQWRNWEGLDGDLLGKVLVIEISERFSQTIDEDVDEDGVKEVADQLVEWYKLAGEGIRFLMANGPLYAAMREHEDTLMLTATLMVEWLEQANEGGIDNLCVG